MDFAGDNATAVRARAGARTPPRAGFDHSRKASSADTPAAACRAADELAREADLITLSFASALCVEDVARQSLTPPTPPFRCSELWKTHIESLFVRIIHPEN